MGTLADAEIEALANEAIELLKGTCKTEASCGQAIENAFKDKRFCAILDQHIFCCEQCNWWCEISEMSQKVEWACDDCEPDNEDD